MLGTSSPSLEKPQSATPIIVYSTRRNYTHVPGVHLPRVHL